VRISLPSIDQYFRSDSMGYSRFIHAFASPNHLPTDLGILTAEIIDTIRAAACLHVPHGVGDGE
jgi:hypothetical protein